MSVIHNLSPLILSRQISDRRQMSYVFMSFQKADIVSLDVKIAADFIKKKKKKYVKTIVLYNNEDMKRCF